MTRLRARWETADDDVRRYTKCVAAAGLVALVVYVSMLWGFGFHPQRTAFGDASFSNFYDVQAHALLDGRLDLRDADLGIEGFIRDGRQYIYYPPGPAIVRMPLLAVSGDALDGKLTAPSMLLAWCTSTVLLSLLLWRVRRLLRPDAHLGRLEALGFGGLVGAISAGSVVLYLASMPFIYHEVYSWAIATALGAAYCMIGFLQRPTTRSLVGAGLFTLGAVLTRTTAGWACALALVLLAGWCLVRRPPDMPTRWVPRILVAGLLPLFVGIAFNWAKFRHPYMFPLEDQVFTQVNEHRRQALEANGGDIVSAKIFPSTSMAYLRPDGIRFTGVFPWITLPARPAAEYGDSFLDQSYRTGSVTAFMPLLFLLSVWGCVTTFRPRAWPGAARLRIPLLGMLAITGAILFYGYIAYRYTSEVVPALALAGGIGYIDLARRLEGRTVTVRRLAFAGAAALALFGFAANFAVAFYTQRINNSDELRTYFRLQEEVSRRTPGDPFRDLIHQSDALPVDGPADELQIVGDCLGVFVGTGEPLWPWVPVELRELGWDLDLRDLPPDAGPIALPLATPIGWPGDGVVLHIEDDTFRATFDTGTDVLGRDPRPLPESGILRLRLVSDLELNQYVLVDIDDPERGLVDIESSLPTEDWFRQQLLFEDALDAPTTVEGIHVTPVPGRPMTFCDHLQSLAS